MSERGGVAQYGDMLSALLDALVAILGQCSARDRSKVLFQCARCCESLLGYPHPTVKVPP